MKTSKNQGKAFNTVSAKQWLINVSFFPEAIKGA